MFKIITTYIFLLAFALQTFSKVFMVMDYVTNTAAFAKNCENKARPQLHCNGQCQLMKKIKKEEKKDQQNPERKAENKNEIFSNQFVYTLLVPGSEPVEVSIQPLLSDTREVKMPRTIFHPPAA